MVKTSYDDLTKFEFPSDYTNMCVIRRKLKPGKVVIINLFRWRILLYSVSSDDFLDVILEVAEQQMWNYSSYVRWSGGG